LIKTLTLTHFVLVEKAEIHFSPQFTIITGETGAGKTAILEALALALGARADASFIRQGQERAIVEAAFDLAKASFLREWLREAGIEAFPGEDLLIRREIAREGKNRALINCQSVPLPFLQKIGSALVDFIGNQSVQQLRTADFQRSILDIFGNGDVESFRKAFAIEKNLQERCDQLRAENAQRELHLPLLEAQLEEIESVSLKEGEDEALFADYQRLAQTEQISEKLKDLVDALADSPLPQIQKQAEALSKIDPAFLEPAALLQQAHIALQEAHFIYQTRLSDTEEDPSRFSFLEERLNVIARLKKKYGQTVQDIDTRTAQIQNQLASYENNVVWLQEAQESLSAASQWTTACAQKLTTKRRASAEQLARVLSSLVQTLNMSKAEVTIEVLPQPRSQDGDDLVQFFLKANPGEEPALVREHCSGGELSRLFLALTLVLAEKNKTPTLIFDEIDANVGGKTGSLIGERLAELSQSCQILCITHFPQVAAKAHLHICVQKEEIEGRTVTTFSALASKERDTELLRMLGGDTSFVPLNLSHLAK
jgi:DNA repair protein RecN (Recombination protein N)